ncbi:putative ferric reductase [Bacillus chungangensis]|uniref:Ferric reductase n=1 Tax=Bacillus chungangensis TaxID=587633 RepID=A0ABT9WQV4_9BACI|nr:putative ferric reductase [Bacillus chungangensis]
MFGEAHLYFGCRNESDFIYREEFEQDERVGIVTLYTAFSRVEGTAKTNDIFSKNIEKQCQKCRYLTTLLTLFFLPGNIKYAKQLDFFRKDQEHLFATFIPIFQNKVERRPLMG